MSIEAMKLALEALETLNCGDTYKTHNAATALRAAIEQAEKQEPVAWWDGSYANPFFRQKKDSPGIGVNGIPLYTAPPQREQRTYIARKWQGLTDADWNIGKHSADFIAGAEWAEAKLKEKNA